MKIFFPYSPLPTPYFQDSYRERVSKLPRLEQQQRELESELQAYQSTYTLLLQKLQETGIAQNQQIGNARIIQAAFVPEDPTSGKLLFIITGIILGGISSVATVFILDKLEKLDLYNYNVDKSRTTVKESKKLFEYTLLGVIPTYQGLEQSTPNIVVRDVPRSPVSAAYRMLQANLEFLTSDKGLKSIVVTSSVPKEGKSTICANLAVTMAQQGQKVLLLDADMYHSLQHQIWELPNQVGFTNVIVGRTELTTAIKEQVMVNLDVLTSGVIPHKPKALLTYERLASLINDVAANYDVVIIDTPSLNIADDALMLGKLADGLLLVARPGVIDSSGASSARELLEKPGHTILGQVINGFNSKNELYGFSYFTNEFYLEELKSGIQNTHTETKI